MGEGTLFRGRWGQRQWWRRREQTQALVRTSITRGTARLSLFPT